MENTPLHTAGQEGHLKICSAIIETLDDKNPRNNTGITPLFIAAKHGHLEICKLIVNQMEAKDNLLKYLIV
jgi:ankyrin repeat protein